MARDVEQMPSAQGFFEPRGFFRGSIVLIENGGSDCFIAVIDWHKSFAMRIQAQCPDGIGKALGDRLRTVTHRPPKVLWIYLCLGRSGKLRAVCAGPPGKNLTCTGKYHRFASARTDIDGKQTHDVFPILACFASRRSSEESVCATESFRPRVPDSITSTLACATETLATPRKFSGTSHARRFQEQRHVLNPPAG